MRAGPHAARWVHDWLCPIPSPPYRSLLARALATEAGANFLHITQSVVKSKWYGESQQNAKAVFTLARKRSPCIIFFDEVDAMMAARDDSQRHDASVLNEMMQEWDGLIQGDNVVVLGATNRPFVGLFLVSLCACVRACVCACVRVCVCAFFLVSLL